MIGEMEGSGYRTPPALARRADGQVVQLTPLLYAVLDAVDGTRTEAEVADVVSAQTGQDVTAENVRTLVDSNLRPAGLLALSDGSQPEVKKSQPLLGLTFKFAVTDPDKTRRLTAPFARLFNPLIVLTVLAGFAVMCWWVLFVKGLGSAAHEAFANPGLLMLVFLVTVLSAGFHEFGHAAAARRGGSTPGTMGAGIYLVWPAFYTDVTDSYRLGRGGRLRTDLGGLYFNAIVALVTMGVWWVSGYDAWLLVIATQILQMIRQLTPLVRFDGYHVLADLTGVPDLFHRIKPTLLGVLPWRWKDPEAAALKPWARAVVTIWVALVVPLLLVTLWTMIIALPRIIGTAWAGLAKQQDLMAAALADDDLVEVLTRPLAMVALAFPVFAIIIILARLGWRIVRSSWQRTKGKPIGRAGTALLGAALVAGLATMWWPQDDRYRPIMAYERGTLVDAASTIPLGRPPTTGLASGSTGSIVTAWADGDPRPTRERPQLAMVLVPRDGDTSAESWVFPFNKPLRARCRRQPSSVGQHEGRHDPVRRRVRPRLGGGRLPRAPAQRVVRVRELHRLRGGVRGVPGRPGHGRQPCRGPAEHRCRGQLRLCRLSHLRPGEAAVRDARRATHRGRAGGARAAVGGDRRLRRGHRRRPTVGDPGEIERLRGSDPADHREGTRPSDLVHADSVAHSRRDADAVTGRRHVHAADRGIDGRTQRRWCGDSQSGPHRGCDPRADCGAHGRPIQHPDLRLS